MRPTRRFRGGRFRTSRFGTGRGVRRSVKPTRCRRTRLQQVAVAEEGTRTFVPGIDFLTGGPPEARQVLTLDGRDNGGIVTGTPKKRQA